jgi:hypothetical protein
MDICLMLEKLMLDPEIQTWIAPFWPEPHTALNEVLATSASRAQFWAQVKARNDVQMNVSE